MRVCAAQIQPIKGNVEDNIALHLAYIADAVRENADLIVFPELSITGYELELAEGLAVAIGDHRFGRFQEASDQHDVVIVIGVPMQKGEGVSIGQLIFQPGKEVVSYEKQWIHEDEEAWFVRGNIQVYIEVKGKVVAPAICYESLLNEHVEQVAIRPFDVYCASVAKPERGVKKALLHYPDLAKKYGVTVVMVNNIGPCDNFIGAGQSGVWNEKGELVKALDTSAEGILVYDVQ